MVGHNRLKMGYVGSSSSMVSKFGFGRMDGWTDVGATDGYAHGQMWGLRMVIYRIPENRQEDCGGTHGSFGKTCSSWWP